MRNRILMLVLGAFLCASHFARAATAREWTLTPVEKDPPVVNSGADAGTGAAGSDMTAAYKELLSRNLFSKNQRVHSRSEFNRGHEPNLDHDTENERNQRYQKDEDLRHAARNDGEIVLIGILDRDGVATATLEDHGGRKIHIVKTGDSLAGGKVGKITIDTMEFIIGGKTISVTYGNNLQGSVSTSKPLEGAAATVPAEVKPGDASGGGAPSAEVESIAAKMRRKRMQEGNK